jgi:hypothetical protein
MDLEFLEGIMNVFIAGLIVGIVIGTGATFWANYVSGVSPFTDSWKRKTDK